MQSSFYPVSWSGLCLILVWFQPVFREAPLIGLMLVGIPTVFVLSMLFLCIKVSSDSFVELDLNRV